MEKSLNDRVAEMTSELLCLKQDMQGISDYGEATGLCDDQEQLVRDVDEFVRSAATRAYRLRRRIEKNKASLSKKASS